MQGDPIFLPVVFVATVIAAIVVIVGSRANRAEEARGEPPTWSIVSLAVTIGSFGLLVWAGYYFDFAANLAASLFAMLLGGYAVHMAIKWWSGKL